MFTRIWRGNGTGLYAQGLVEGLVSAGSDVTFICPMTTSPAFERPRSNLRRIRQPREADGSPLLSRLVASLTRMAGGTLALLRARLRNRIFIFSLPDPLILFVPQLWMLRLTGARVILVAHDPLPHAWKLPAWLRRVEVGGYWLSYAGANAVVVLSEASHRRIREAFPRLRSPVAVIDHGPFVMAEPTPPPAAHRLLMFGTLRRNKGILEGMQAVLAARHEGLDVRLVVAGGPHKEDMDYAKECLTLARSAPEAIDMRLDYVPDDQVGELIAGSDALLMPYRDFHSQSGVAILAASNARPVIAAPAGGMETLFDEGMAGIRIAQPVTVQGIQDAILAFFREPSAAWYARSCLYRSVILDCRSWPLIGARHIELALALSGKTLQGVAGQGA